MIHFALAIDAVVRTATNAAAVLLKPRRIFALRQPRSIQSQDRNGLCVTASFVMSIYLCVSLPKVRAQGVCRFLRWGLNASLVGDRQYETIRPFAMTLYRHTLRK